MQVARLHGPKDIRLADEPPPPSPAQGEVCPAYRYGRALRQRPLHLYETGRIGYTDARSPFVLGHEFMGVVDALGDDALDGLHEPLQIGQRVAVDPAVPCWRCELCEQGHPNLCPNHIFYGLYPEDGALREHMIVSARNCFPMPDSISNESGPLLETLGVAIHALDLANLRIGSCRCAGRRTGRFADRPLGCVGWRRSCHRQRQVRLALAKGARLGGCAYAECRQGRSGCGSGRADGRDEAWMWRSKQPGLTIRCRQAAEMARYGGRLVLVGIPPDDKLCMQHSVARRKGLTIMMSRRMKHSYPRAIQLAASGKVALDELVSHRFPLAQTASAYASNAAYEPGVNKVILQVGC